MRKRSLPLACVGMVLLFCTACGSKKMPDDVLQAAVKDQDENYSSYSLNITDFSVTDRDYDKQYKTEDVTVQVTAENNDSTYQATYDIMGSTESGNWRVTNVQMLDAVALPKEEFPDELVEEKAEELLQDKENQTYNLTAIGSHGHTSNTIKPDLDVDLELCSETPYLSSTKDYTLQYHYTLSGWDLVSTDADDTKFEITDDLCGTWTASTGDDSYTFVIDHIADGIAYVKYSANMLMPQYGWSTVQITEGYDNLTAVPINVVYNDWEAPYYGLEIMFDKVDYAEYGEGWPKSKLTIMLHVYPRTYGNRQYANGTLDDGSAAVVTEINTPSTTHPINGQCILTKQ